ncbi:preprotein translocase subunit SecE [Halarsenatibacter silvermanii]|nr:preprotein translocase subunit SecE [Halarsenatibacter silvermanii]
MLLNKLGFINRVTGFFKKVKSEMKKTTWPNRDELTSYTTIVLLTCLALIAFLGVADVLISNIVTPFFM